MGRARADIRIFILTDKMVKNKKVKENKSIEELISDVGGEKMFADKTEIGEAFANLDEDTQDADKMSNIDLNTRLTGDEISCITIIDEFVRMGILPEEAGITRQTKRLNISRDGKGRAEKVQIASAGIEREKVSGLKKLFTPRE